jgi:hypothetical protein
MLFSNQSNNYYGISSLSCQHLTAWLNDDALIIPPAHSAHSFATISLLQKNIKEPMIVFVFVLSVASLNVAQIHLTESQFLHCNQSLLFDKS